MKKIIVVNATAAREGGALTILYQLIDNIELYDPHNYYLIFVDQSFKKKEVANISYNTVQTSKWSERIKWDVGGLRKYLNKHNLQPHVIISLQNMGVRYDCPQIVYYHQLLPLERYKWNPFKSSERILFMYKNFYGFFVKRLTNKDTIFIAQIPSTKDKMVKRFKIDPDKIVLIRPNIRVTEDTPSASGFNDSTVRFIYPAIDAPYKNHRILAEALSILKERAPEKASTIKIHITLEEDKSAYVRKLANNYKVIDNFVFEGKIEYVRLMQYYANFRGLLFPSYIETFGLPLIEAASKGLCIVAADIPYAHDVIGDYKGTRFVPYNNAEAWAGEIEKLYDNEAKFAPLKPDTTNDWIKLFDIINRI